MDPVVPVGASTLWFTIMSFANQPEHILSRNPLLNPDLREFIIGFFGPRDVHVAVVSKSFEASYERCVNPAATAATGHRSPLRNAGIRGRIFGYVGAGHYLFLGLVSKGFNDSYQKVEQCEVMSYGAEACVTEIISCSARMTLMRAAVASAALFRLAVDRGGLLQLEGGMVNPAGSCSLPLVSLATSAFYKQPSLQTRVTLSFAALLYLAAFRSCSGCAATCTEGPSKLASVATLLEAATLA
jgi:hypothetical protein